MHTAMHTAMSAEATHKAEVDIAIPHHPSGATAIGPDVWRLGRRGVAGHSLQHHSYLLRLAANEGGGDTDNGPVRWVWVDPGGVAELSVIEDQACQLMGGRDHPLLVVATGLGEGSVGALPEVLERFPHALLLTNAETWNFLTVTRVAAERVRLVERYRSGLHFPEVERTLQVVANPYGQFTGAVLLFEPRSGCLMSGELLAAEADPEPRPDLFAHDDDWPRVRRLQERRMPCNAALRWTLTRVRQLEGLRCICPQSGPLLTAPVLHSFVARLEDLPVGADLLNSEEEFLGL